MGRVLNSGPAPDPNALRRNRKDDTASWRTLPPTGLQGDIPSWPAEIERASVKELALWTRLWREQPQAHIWRSHHLDIQVATYVRTALFAAQSGVAATYLTAVRQQAEGLLLTPAALRSSRYKVTGDEPDAAPANPDRPATTGTVSPIKKPGSSVLGRLGLAVAPQPSTDLDDEDDDFDTPTDEDE